MLADYVDDELPYDLGDVSFHSGWTYHHAGANRTDEPREVFTVIYLDRDARLREPSSAFERFDARTWCPGVEPGELISTELNPILYERGDPG
jgi:hypothetical protein